MAKTQAFLDTLINSLPTGRLAHPIQHMQVPSTVHMVLEARIDRLSTEAKHLLQAAAVIGKDVPFPLLQAIVERPEELVRRGRAGLQAAEFLDDLPEAGYNIRTVQERLGHKDVRTTMIYTHVLNQGGKDVRSPLDTMCDEDGA